MKGVSNALARLPIWWGRHSVQRAPLSTNGEQVGHYHPKFEGGKVVSAVVMPPQAHRELQGKQNKTKLNKTCTCVRRHVCKKNGVYRQKSSVRVITPSINGEYCQRTRRSVQQNGATARMQTCTHMCMCAHKLAFTDRNQMFMS